MAEMKFAISVPDELFEAGEHLARQLGVSRCQLYTDALSAYLNVRGAAAVTARLNAAHSRQPRRLDPALAAAQMRQLEDEAW